MQRPAQGALVICAARRCHQVPRWRVEGAPHAFKLSEFSTVDAQQRTYVCDNHIAPWALNTASREYMAGRSATVSLVNLKLEEAEQAHDKAVQDGGA